DGAAAAADDVGVLEDRDAPPVSREDRAGDEPCQVRAHDDDVRRCVTIHDDLLCNESGPWSTHYRGRRTSPPCLSAQSCIASSTGSSDFPSGVRQYSTCGGTSP